MNDWTNGYFWDDLPDSVPVGPAPIDEAQDEYWKNRQQAIRQEIEQESARRMSANPFREQAAAIVGKKLSEDYARPLYTGPLRPGSLEGEVTMPTPMPGMSFNPLKNKWAPEAENYMRALNIFGTGRVDMPVNLQLPGDYTRLTEQLRRAEQANRVYRNQYEAIRGGEKPGSQAWFSTDLGTAYPLRVSQFGAQERTDLGVPSASDTVMNVGYVPQSWRPGMRRFFRSVPGQLRRGYLVARDWATHPEYLRF